jgi:hypothetical protein
MMPAHSPKPSTSQPLMDLLAQPRWLVRSQHLTRLRAFHASGTHDGPHDCVNDRGHRLETRGCAPRSCQRVTDSPDPMGAASLAPSWATR